MNFKKLGKFIGIFFIYVLAPSLIVIVLNNVGIKYQELSNTMKLVVNIGGDILVSIILFIIYHKYLIEKFKDFKQNFGKYSEIGLKAWGIGLAIMYVSNIILYTFSPVKEAINESAVQDLISASPILAFIFTTVFAPFIEEMIFRKGIQDIFNNKKIFIIISGIVFGLLHVIGAESIFDFLYIIPYAALGMSFAHALYKTDNIYTTIMIHLIHNGILTLISILF